MSARTLAEMDYADLAAFIETNGASSLELVLSELHNRTGGKVRRLVSAMSAALRSIGEQPVPEPKKRGRPRKVAAEPVASVPDVSPVVGLTPEITAAWSGISAAKLAAFREAAPITMDGRPLRFTPDALERMIKDGAKAQRKYRSPRPVVPAWQRDIPVPAGDVRDFLRKPQPTADIIPITRKPAAPKRSSVEDCADALNETQLGSDEGWIDHLRRYARVFGVELSDLTAELQLRWDASTAPVAIAA